MQVRSTGCGISTPVVTDLSCADDPAVREGIIGQRWLVASVAEALTLSMRVDETLDVVVFCPCRGNEQVIGARFSLRKPAGFWCLFHGEKCADKVGWDISRGRLHSNVN